MFHMGHSSCFCPQRLTRMLHSKNYSGSNQGPVFVYKTLTQLQYMGILTKKHTTKITWNGMVMCMMQESFRSWNLTFFNRKIKSILIFHVTKIYIITLFSMHQEHKLTQFTYSSGEDSPQTAFFNQNTGLFLIE